MKKINFLSFFVKYVIIILVLVGVCMKRREVKRNIENKVLKLELTNETIDDIYETLPKIIKVCNKKYMIDLIYNNEKIDIDYEMKMTGNFTIETLTTLIAKFSNYFNNAEKKIDRVIQLLSNTLEKL